MKKLPVPVLLVFLCMGLGDVAGPLVGLAKDSFHLTNFVAQFICFAGFIMFGILTIPMGRFVVSFGTKLTLLLGLSLAFTGLVIPMLSGMYGNVQDLAGMPQSLFYILLFSILLLGAAMSIFSTVGSAGLKNTVSEEVFPGGSRGVVLMKAMGTSLGFLLPPFVIIELGLSWTLVFPVYAIMIAIIWMSVSANKNLEARVGKLELVSWSTTLELLSNASVVMMVLGLFLYVGAEISMFSGLPMLLKEKWGMAQYGLWMAWLLFFLPLMAGRLFGTFILKFLKPQPFLLISAIISFAGILMLTIGSRFITFPGIVMAGLGFSNIFRLIYLLTEHNMPGKTIALKGLVGTALAGGAIMPLLMGLIADVGENIAMGFIAPLFAVLYILFLSIISRPETENVHA